MLLCPTIVWGLQFRKCKRRGDFKFCFFAPSKQENTQNTNQKQGHGGESRHFKSSTREQNLQQFLRSCFLSHQDSRWVAQRRRFSYSGKPISNASGGFGNWWVFPFLFWKLKLWWGHLFPTFLSLRYHNIFTKKSDQIPTKKEIPVEGWRGKSTLTPLQVVKRCQNIRRVWSKKQHGVLKSPKFRKCIQL